MQQSVHIIYPQNDSLILIEREIYEQRCQFWKSKEQNCSSIWRLKSSCIFRFIEKEFSDHLMKRRTNVIKLLSFLILLNLKKNVLLSHQIMYQWNTNQNHTKWYRSTVTVTKCGCATAIWMVFGIVVRRIKRQIHLHNFDVYSFLFVFFLSPS